MEQLQFSSQLLENLTTAVLVLDPMLGVSYLNPAAEALLDCSQARIAGQPLGGLFAPGFNKLPGLEQQIHSGLPSTRRAIEMPLAGGKQVTVDLVITPLESAHETASNSDPIEPAFMLLEFHSLDRILQISREETQLSSHSKSRSLIRGLAHEIKNPLGGLRGAAQLLDKELQDPSLSEYTHVIIEEADRLRNLVDKLLGPNQAMVIKSVNVHEILERVCTLINAENNSAIEIIRDYDPSIPDIQADSERCIQAVLNIMRNAWQALESMEPGHQGKIRLTTRVVRQFTIGPARHSLVAKVDIQDNGPGIDPELLPTVFYPMISGRPDGTGLGLSLSQSIAHQHQGLIECQSKPGETIFSFYLPLEPIDA